MKHTTTSFMNKSYKYNALEHVPSSEAINFLLFLGGSGVAEHIMYQSSDLSTVHKEL